MSTQFSARKGGLALLLLIAACNGDDAQTTQDTGADDDDSGSATQTETDPTAADDDPSAGSSDGTTAAETSASDTSPTDTSAGESSTAGSSDASSSDDGSSSSGTPGCVPVDAEPIVSEPLAGDSACEGVPNNAVITDDAGLQAHFDEFCDTLDNCQFPAPPCDDPPDVDLEAQRIVYVFGQSSGCTGTAQIDEVLDCGDEVEVHYTIGSSGPCDLIVYGWDSAVIPDGPDVVFIEG